MLTFSNVKDLQFNVDFDNGLWYNTYGSNSNNNELKRNIKKKKGYYLL